MDFYSYSPAFGMEYHPSKEAAIEAATEGMKLTHLDQANQVTWGEVTERGVDTTAGAVLKRQDRLTYEAAYPQVVNGRMEDAAGSLVLLKNIRETDLLEHDLVLSIAAIWKGLAGKIARFKEHNFSDVTTFVDLLFEKHNTKRGGTQGNMTFGTFDRKFKLVIAIQKTLDFGPEIEVAKAKMLQAAREMGNGSQLEGIVTASLTQVDGKLRVAEVLRLCRHKVDNDTWNEGVAIIKDAINVVNSKKQVRMYERNDQGAYVAIPLDIAAI
ncbi:DUF3164 family protein [Geobacter pelophilus]|uniref:DUF3164 family protein n=1 Tax=Geoanaerobacter pelophilus TaxID=60036 RepID=A0AAW4LCW1_9BACT|nr:DUF3164 family protein [Geoanaerobacter pelophilus]